MSTVVEEIKTQHQDRPKEGLADVVATHYNEIKEVGIASRKESRIFKMRTFNNWIKSMLLGEAFDKIRSEKDYHTRISVLDMGCGKGGDLRKYSFGRIHHLIATDIAETSLSQCEDRYNEMVNDAARRNRNRYQNQRLFSAEFFAADATRDVLRQKFRDSHRTVEVVSSQFVVHYSFESLEQAEMLLRNASESLRTDGFFIGTTTDANDIIKRIRQSKSRKIGNDVFSIEFENDDVLDVNKKLPLFGTKYHFKLDGVVDCPEFLLHFPTFVEIAEKYGLSLVLRERFEDYYSRVKETHEGRTTLRRMNVFEPYTQSEGKNPEDYEHAEEFLKNLPEDGRNRKIGTLSKSEWEAISVYLVFVFRKISPEKRRELQAKRQRTE